MVYEVVVRKGATVNQGATEQALENRSFNTVEEAKQFVVEAYGVKTSGGKYLPFEEKFVRRVAERSGFDSGEIREVSSPTPFTVVSGPASRIREENRRESRERLERRQSGISFEEEKQLIQLEKAREQGKISERSYNELASNIANREELEQINKDNQARKAEAQQQNNRLEVQGDLFSRQISGAINRGEVNTAKDIIEKQRSLPDQFQSPTTQRSIAEGSKLSRDVREDRVYGPGYGFGSREAAKEAYEGLNREKAELEGNGQLLLSRGTIDRSNSVVDPSSSNIPNSERFTRLGQEAQYEADFKEQSRLGYIKSGLVASYYGARAKISFIREQPLTYAKGFYQSTIELIKNPFGTTREVIQTISQEPFFQAGNIGVDLVVTKGLSKGVGKGAVKLTTSDSYIKASKYFDESVGGAALSEVGLKVLPRPKYPFKVTEVPKGEPVAVSTTYKELPLGGELGSPITQKITTVEVPIRERTVKRKTVPKIQKSVGIEASKVDVVKTGTEQIGPTNVNIIQVGTNKLTGYLKLGVLRGKQTFNSLSEVFKVRSADTPKVDIRATTQEISPYEGFQLIKKEPKRVNEVGGFGLFVDGVEAQQIKSVKNTNRPTYVKYQFTQDIPSTSNVPGIQSTSLLKGKLVRFTRPTPKRTPVIKVAKPKKDSSPKGFEIPDIRKKALEIFKEQKVSNKESGQVSILKEPSVKTIQQSQPTTQVLSYKVKTRSPPALNLGGQKQSFTPTQTYETTRTNTLPSKATLTTPLVSLSFNQSQSQFNKQNTKLNQTPALKNRLDTRPLQSTGQSLSPVLDVAPKLDVRTSQTVRQAIDTRLNLRQRVNLKQKITIRTTPPDEPTRFRFPNNSPKQSSYFEQPKTTKKRNRKFSGPPTLSAILTGQGTKLTKRQIQGKAFISPFQTRRV